MEKRKRAKEQKRKVERHTHMHTDRERERWRKGQREIQMVEINKNNLRKNGEKRTSKSMKRMKELESISIQRM